MEAMIENKTNFAALSRDLKIYPQVLENIRVKDKDKVLNDPKVVAICKKVEEDLGDSGRVLVRKSGTEPLLRVMVEAETDETAKEKTKEIVEVIKSTGLCD